MEYHEMLLIDVCKLPGIDDLSMPARGKFGQALQAESGGDFAHAQELLDAAVSAESAREVVQTRS